MKNTATRLMSAAALCASAVVAPVVLTASPAQAAAIEYTVETPAPDAGAGCTRYTRVGVDSEKPGLPVILQVYITCS